MVALPDTDSVTIGRGPEWQCIEIPDHGLRDLDNAVIEVTVSGNAAAAGLSFGHYKDFLVPVDNRHSPRRLQLELDRDPDTFALRADGRAVGRAWWDEGVRSFDDLRDGTLMLKARDARDVVFRDLRVRPLGSRARLSVVITCFRFARRLRVALDSWCRQSIPSGALEVVVVNPGSPDITHDVVAAAARAHPEVRVREVLVDATRRRNKGFLINRGVAATHGEWIWLTDADCVFPPDAAARVLANVGSPSTFLFCERRHLTETATDAVLRRQIDPVGQFDALLTMTRSDSDICPLGYCQIIHRGVIERTPYREDLNVFSSSDNTFADQCAAAGIAVLQLKGLICLHLVHPFAWYGTNLLL